ncbi:hypothetical protein ACFQZV_09185 [Microbacterium koreense]|uniref:Uncharacterized protein n=1 Tax=Microbacterium koreense TaxID=323761 RepID=A0ABW2ZSQ2_9MICO
MTSRSRLRLSVVAAGILALGVAGCATPSPDAPGGLPSSTVPAPPIGEVIGQGTVLDDGEGAELCLGAVMASNPPQCSGIPLVDWSWDAVDGEETASGTTWGTYAVQGTYDGRSFTVTRTPIMLALYDPMAPADPTGGRPGAGTEAQLQEIQDEVPALFGDAALSSYADDGWLWIDVVWDDGTWQDAMDAAYGDDVVIVRSALQPAGG